MLEYRIVQKERFTVLGRLRHFEEATSYREIPAFWEEHMMSEEGKLVCGHYGICLGSDGSGFDYMIADDYVPGSQVPERLTTREFPAGTWAVFPCRGALPEALQSVNTRIWNEWLPACRTHRLAGNYNLEVYTPPTRNPEDNYNEIWIPVEPVSGE